MKNGSKPFGTIKSEIFLLSLLFFTLVSALFAGIFLRILYLNNINSAKNSLWQCNSQIVTYTEGIFHENATLAELLAKNDSVIHAGHENPAAVTAIYNALQKSNMNITYVYSGYSNGRLLINNYKTPAGFDPSTRPWYLAAESTDGVARLVYRDVITGGWLFSQCKKLTDSDGNMLGVVSIDCSNESISRQLSTKYQYESQRSFIVAPDGTILIHPEEDKINVSMMTYLGSKTWDSIRSDSSNYAEYEYDGIKSMAYFERIPETDFIAVTAIDASEVIRPIVRSMGYLLAVIIGLSVVLGLVLGHTLLYRFARPIMALGARIQNIASGCPGKNERSGISSSNAEMKRIAEGIELIVQNISLREEQRKEAEHLSFHDSMTGLYNRRFFDEEQRRLDTVHSLPLGLICCDINGLKMVNDVFGHDAGDQLIKRVAECLKKGCRAGDVLARVGGDEFSILLPRAAESEIRQIIQNIEHSLLEKNLREVVVSASVGYAIKTEMAESMDELMRAADKMMYGKKLTESQKMKSDTVANIIEAAKKEGFVKPVSEKEKYVLRELALALNPEGFELLEKSYLLRDIGLSAIFESRRTGDGGFNKRHTETGYRVLSVLEEYRSVAGCVLHYTEHWDGSGWPVGLSGKDIPLLCRIIAVADAYFSSGENLNALKKHSAWYDPDIVNLFAKDGKL